MSKVIFLAVFDFVISGLQVTDVNHDERISTLEENGGSDGSKNGGSTEIRAGLNGHSSFSVIVICTVPKSRAAVDYTLTGIEPHGPSRSV